MPVLTVANSKGGTGKTLVCAVLCARLASDGVRVAAIDADPNRTLYEWRSQSTKVPPSSAGQSPMRPVGAHDPGASGHLPPAPHRHRRLRQPVGYRGHGVGRRGPIPTTTSRADVVETGKTVRLAEGLAKAARRQVPVRVVGNRIKRALVSRHALSELDEANLPRLSTTLSDVVAYVELTHTGRLPAAPPAALEIASLVDELRELGWLPR